MKFVVDARKTRVLNAKQFMIILLGLCNFVILLDGTTHCRINNLINRSFESFKNTHNELRYYSRMQVYSDCTWLSKSSMC